MTQTAPTNPPDHTNRWTEFSRAIAQRRADLGLSLAQLYKAGGPSRTVTQRLEKPKTNTPDPRPTTFKHLDTGLQWEHGTAADLFAGKLTYEQVINHSHLDGVTTSPLLDPLSPYSFIPELSRDLLGFFADIAADPTTSDNLKQLAEALSTTIGDHYVTALLETYGGPGRVLSEHIRALILPSLTKPAPPQGTDEYIRWQYRRWLAGFTLEDTSNIAVFEKRWENRP